MKIKYDSEADIVYIKLISGKFGYNKVVDENTVLDFDEKGNLLGIELLFVKKNMPNLLKEFKLKKLIPA